MKNIIVIIFTLLLGFNAHAQFQRGQRGQRGQMNRIPQTNTEPTEQEIEKRKREMEERKEEYIDNFILTLEGDEFQKHIVKQHISSFFEAKIAILKTPFDHSLDRKKAIEHLENTHFKELEELISESDMSKIKELVKGEFKEKEVVKEKKKKRKKRKKKKKQDTDEG